ncbi:MAG TPA: DHH family phosphoesterase [Candidatus Nanoarchaeia archaeon]|nr:DHH family phosphoesterase [Candidatus Nanoarchaeia archaeon]
MPLTDDEVKTIKEELDNCQNPLYFFHDDPDGMCSFLLFYRYKKEGNGIVVKRTTPTVDEKFLPKVAEYSPDKIFILDLAVVDQEFIDKVKVPVVWIDHHQPIPLHGLKIFNPRIKAPHDNTPATYLCYQVVKQDLWIAAVGCTGDWYYPDFMPVFKEQYPDLVKIGSKDPGAILHNSKLGTLTRIFAFILKGDTQDIKKCYKILTRIQSPSEILDQTTPQGTFLYRKFLRVNKEYAELIKEAEKHVKKDPLLCYIYPSSKTSFSGDLANELMYKFPDKLIIVGRQKNDAVKMSLRYGKPLLSILQEALKDVEGYGGGHEYACGASVKKEHFEQFLKNIRKHL